MIPVRLKIRGFLSYREPAEVDFTGFGLACISGANGAGKSSLLDAMTWALFGQARKRDEAVINAASQAAEVIFIFAYESSQFRVQRALARGKGTILEFQIGETDEAGDTAWRPLTEKTVRDTQTRIQQILRLDYETFVNASFFLQGKADQFTQQRPSERKRILASILGLDAWDVYRERASERRRRLETDRSSLDGQLREIEGELSEEPARTTHLRELESQMESLAMARKLQAEALENARRLASGLAEQRRLVDSLRGRLDRAQSSNEELAKRLDQRKTERKSYAEMLACATEIEAAYRGWQAARAEVEKLDGLADQFREQEARRQPFVDEINAERIKLEHARSTLLEEQARVGEQQAGLDRLEAEIAATQVGLQESEARLAERDAGRTRLEAIRTEAAALRAENEALKRQMDETKERIARMEQIETPTCPLCGQPLSPEHRESTIAQLNAEGKTMGDRHRGNRARLDALAEEARQLEPRLAELNKAEDSRLAYSSLLSTLKERKQASGALIADWEAKGAKELVRKEKQLGQESYAPEARAKLKGLDKELKSLGYDAAAHARARQAEQEGRSSEAELRGLESARAALAPLEREIGDLGLQVTASEAELMTLRADHDAAAARLAADEAQVPDLQAAELALIEAQERENVLNRELGAARQKVDVLADLRKRRQSLIATRESIGLNIAHHKTLERAFGKDGVPALLIEQALPEIETHANEVLDRLSDGSMSVRFATQAEYKDKKREDLKETLDILISDGSGTRDYEMFSGGEAFRVNFAIRLALSQVLAQRTGARLQMLVIDEGFGSQDAQGRQRLIEAINLASHDFAKILVITHMDELKDAFPNRIEVEKTPAGSVVQVM